MSPSDRVPPTVPDGRPALIELDGLVVRFGAKTILNELTSTLSGRAIGLLGPNGAGKTTLIHTLLGFHPAQAGSARVMGLDIRLQNREIRRLTGYMPENDSFIAGLSALRLTRMLAEITGLPRAAALERAHEEIGRAHV